MRVTANDNPSKISLKNLFMKFCVSYGSVKKEHLFIEFLKVAQECALMDGFNQRAEIEQVIDFAQSKFEFELQTESQLDEDSPLFREHLSSLHDRKLHLLHIVHILLQRVISEKRLQLVEFVVEGPEAVKFILGAQKKFIISAI